VNDTGSSRISLLLLFVQTHLDLCHTPIDEQFDAGDITACHPQTKQIPDNSIDLIFTDPPYATKDLPLYAELAKLAARVLKPGGNLVTYSGHYCLPQVFDYLEHSNLKYIHQIIVQHSGQREILFAYNIGVKYKPLLWFVKGANSPYSSGSTSYIEDVIPSEPVGKEFHKWEQSTVEAEYMISKLTVENQAVLDPFLGGGTTAIAALKLNRKFIGIEIDEDSYNIAKGRIAKFLQHQNEQQ
jgi:16S rRNA G966 N2-methylase RsmD